MVCPKCGSNNVNVQMTNQVFLKRKHRSILAWLLFWWWVEMLLWIFLTIPRLIVAFLRLIFGGKQKAVNVTKKYAVCQDCGNSWEI